MEINEEESSASSSSSDVVVHAWQVACNSNNTTGSQSPSKEQVLVAALTSNDTKTTMATTHKRKAGRKKFRETRHPIFKGVRERNGGKWVCEVREPNKKSRIWLGTFASPDMAARAYDVAALALRGKSAPLNFPDSAWFLPRAKSSSPRDIQLAALQAANSFQPPRPPPPASTCSPTATSSTTSSSLTTPAAASKFPRVKEREKCTSVETAAAAERGASSTTTFMDEEAMFNMPALLDSMFEGMLLTPPSMKQRFSWDDVDRHMDFSLWSD